MGSETGKSRFRLFERDIELEIEPLELRDTIGLILIFASLCVVSCGGVLFYGSAALRVHGRPGWTGLALILGGSAAFALVVWRLQPHKAVKHASHRLRYHARKLRQGQTQPMTDVEFNALEDAVDRSATQTQG